MWFVLEIVNPKIKCSHIWKRTIFLIKKIGFHFDTKTLLCQNGNPIFSVSFEYIID